MTHTFLSEEWVEGARQIRSEYDTVPVPHVVRLNMVVTEVPFSGGQVLMHVDTTNGDVEIDVGHLEDPDLNVTVDYVTARSILVDGGPQAAAQAFMTGRIQVRGDMSKLLLLQSAPPDPSAQEMADRLREMTE